jgi:Zn/Cd-binding protein ZinT
MSYSKIYLASAIGKEWRKKANKRYYEKRKKMLIEKIKISDEFVCVFRAKCGWKTT